MNQRAYCCSCMETYIRSEDGILLYVPTFDEYGIPVCGSENGKTGSYIQIQYCPWCGKKLPGNRRGDWVKQLNALGYDDPFSEKSPVRFQTDEWYRGR